MITDYTYTDKQMEAFDLLASAKYCLLYGGARSGKSFAICRKILHRAIRYPGSRFLIARLRLIHTRTSVYRETLLPMLRYFLADDAWHYDGTEHVVTLYNGSEIWLGGFDSRERTEKLLGHEYLDIYFNEISQLSYDSVVIGMTRLAQQIPGVENKGYFDCNPPSRLHWAFRLFIEKLDPTTLEPLPKAHLYDSIKMNPADNLANLADGYIENVLDIMNAKTRARMRDGEWVRPEGVIFDKLDESAIIEPTEVPPIEWFSAGTDFGLNMAGLFIGWSGENIYALTDHGGFNCTTSTFNTAFLRKQFIMGNPDPEADPRLLELGVEDQRYVNYCDPSGGERIQEIRYGAPANNSVEPGLDYINTKAERGQIKIVKTCYGLLSEVFDYARDERGQVIKVNDHHCDAFRYAVFSPSTKRRWRAA